MGFLNILTPLYALLIAIIVGWVAIRKKNSQKPRDDHHAKKFGAAPQLPQRDGQVGLLWFLQSLKSFRDGTYNQDVETLLHKIGTTFSYYILGSKTFVTCEPENARAILSSSQTDYESGPRRRTALASIIQKGIFALDGKEWQHARATLRPAFARKHIQDYAMMEDHFQKLISAIAHENYETDLQVLFFRYTLDTATSMLTGESVNSLSAHGAESVPFMESWDLTNSHIMRLFFIGPWGRWLPFPAVSWGKKYLYEYLDNLITKRLASNRQKEANGSVASSKPQYVFLDSLAQQTQDPIFLRDQTLSALAGARDTTASLLSNLCFILARRADIWEKLRHEACSLESVSDTNEAISKAVYTQYCIHECLRLLPAVPAIGRYAVKDTSLPRGGGKDGSLPVFVPAGTDVLVSQWSMHRRVEDFGTDADSFNPSRWETLDAGWAYIPFGGGQRVCLGQHFALNEATFMMLRLAQSFKSIEPASDAPWKEKLSFTLASLLGCPVILHPA